MNTDVIIAIVTSAIGATWVLRSKLSDMQTDLGQRLTRVEDRVEVVEDKVIKLEEWKNGRR